MSNKKPYTIGDLLRDVHDDLPQFHRETIDEAVRVIFSEIQESLVNQEKVVLKRFGSFNPRLGKIPPSNLKEFPTRGEKKYYWYVFFRPSSILKKAINANISNTD